MINKLVALLSASLILVLGMEVSLVLGSLGGGPDSLVKVTTALCTPQGPSVEVATEFGLCYDVIPKDEKCLFQKCQNRVFGNLLDSRDHILHACSQATKLTQYSDCLIDEFKSCRKDIVTSLTKINDCQGPLIGLGW